jgi:hypothetical protein
MASPFLLSNQSDVVSLADDCQSFDRIAAQWAGALAESPVDWTRSERQLFSDVRRLDASERRRAMFHTIDRLIECATRAPRHVATLGPELMRGMVMRLFTAGDILTAIDLQNLWNSHGNRDEFRFAMDQQNPARAEALAYSWNGELSATRWALDTLHAHRPRRLISVPRS